MKNGSIISMVLLMTFTRLLFSAFSLYKKGTKTKEEKGYWELMILDGKADLINTGCLGTETGHMEVPLFHSFPEKNLYLWEVVKN